MAPELTATERWDGSRLAVAEIFLLALLVLGLAITRKSYALSFHLKSGRSLGPKADLFCFRLLRLVWVLTLVHITLTDVWKLVSVSTSIFIVTICAVISLLYIVYEVSSLPPDSEDEA